MSYIILPKRLLRVQVLAEQGLQSLSNKTKQPTSDVVGHIAGLVHGQVVCGSHIVPPEKLELRSSGREKLSGDVWR